MLLKIGTGGLYAPLASRAPMIAYFPRRNHRPAMFGQFSALVNTPDFDFFDKSRNATYLFEGISTSFLVLKALEAPISR